MVVSTSSPNASQAVLALKSKQLLVSLVRIPGRKFKTPSVQTLGVLLFGLLNVQLVNADCMPAGTGEKVVVTKVYDGDTLKLEDGRHVRVLGINAPEIDHGNDKAGQALGEDSRRAAERFIKSAQSIRLFYDRETTDRYGRTLAHVYDADENSLAASLLRSGLAFHVAIPPNLSLNDCLSVQESVARKTGLGIWSHANWQAKPAASLTQDDTGFQRIKGRVVNLSIKRSVWLELDGPLVIQISEDDLKQFPSVNWNAYEGKIVEVRGWVVNRKSDKFNKNSGGKSFKPLMIQPRIAGNLEMVP